MTSIRLPAIGSIIKHCTMDLEGKPVFYREFQTDDNRMSGQKKRRPIMKPNGPMRHVQDKMREYLRTLPVDYTYATAYLPGSAVIKNVRRHRYNQYFYLLDVKGAYDQVSGKALVRVISRLVSELRKLAFRDMGSDYELIDPRDRQAELWSDDIRDTATEEDLYEFLERYFLLRDGMGLPQGGPASQDLFNIYMAVLLDGRLGEYCRKHGFTYSRFGDDLTISSPTTYIGKVYRRKIRAMLSDLDMPLSHHKCQVVDLDHSGGHSVIINGIRLERGGMMYTPQKFIRQAYAFASAAYATGERHLFYKATGLVGCVKHVAQERDLTREEEKLFDIYERMRERWPELLVPEGQEATLTI